MGAEFIPLMGGDDSSSGSHFMTEFEHEVSLILPGDSDSLRARLNTALEQLGYRVISEQPLLAKRGGRNNLSGNLLDYARTLMIGLKPLGEQATRVTFDFTIKNPYGITATKGDRQTILREAEAIAALARVRSESAACAACGTEGAADARFCRRCGAPVMAARPAEVEVLRLTAGERAAHQMIVSGAIILAVMFLFLLPLSFVNNPKAEKILIFFSIISGIAGWLTLFFGMRRLHRTLNPKRATEAAPTDFPRAIPSSHTVPLPAQSIPVSVTEGTTDLLEPEPPRSRITNQVEPWRESEGRNR